MNSNIILCGIPGTGKSEAGKELAAKLHWTYVDTDDCLVNTYRGISGKVLTCREIYIAVGEVAFRELEYKMLLSLVNTHESVISTGGGTLNNPRNIAVLKKMGSIIYLMNERNVIFKRLMQKGIPAYLDPKDLLQSFMKLAEEREKIYSAAADIKLHTEKLSPSEVADMIISKLPKGFKHGL